MILKQRLTWIGENKPHDKQYHDDRKHFEMLPADTIVIVEPDQESFCDCSKIID
jgi:hypothetical protein